MSHTLKRLQFLFLFEKVSINHDTVISSDAEALEIKTNIVKKLRQCCGDCFLKIKVLQAMP